MSQFNTSGSKYLRPIQTVDGCVDVYAVLDAFDVRCPARQHAVKKLLCAGIRGKGDEAQDLLEARDAVDRAVQMQAARLDSGPDTRATSWISYPCSNSRQIPSCRRSCQRRSSNPARTTARWKAALRPGAKIALSRFSGSAVLTQRQPCFAICRTETRGWR